MNTNTDIRIAVSFKGHRKRRKLRMLLGSGSTDYLIDLWINTATNHPDGVLVGMSSLDVALEAGWEDDPEKFVGAMIESGFLDQDEDGTFRLHDWEDHQPFVIEAPKRSQQAKKAAEARWSKKPAKPSESKMDAQSMPSACGQHSDRNAPTYLPTKEEENTTPLPPAAPAVPNMEPYSMEFLEFWEAYPNKEAQDDAWIAWLELKKARKHPGLSVLQDAICVQEQGERWQDPKFIPSPGAWLRKGRWKDKPPEPRAAPRASPPRGNLTPRQQQTEMFKGMAQAIKRAEGAGNGENHGGRCVEGALPAGTALPRS